jgi:hypothetical protein
MIWNTIRSFKMWKIRNVPQYTSCYSGKCSSGSRDPIFFKVCQVYDSFMYFQTLCSTRYQDVQTFSCFVFQIVLVLVTHIVHEGRNRRLQNKSFWLKVPQPNCLFDTLMNIYLSWLSCQDCMHESPKYCLLTILSYLIFFLLVQLYLN